MAQETLLTSLGPILFVPRPTLTAVWAWRLGVAVCYGGSVGGSGYETRRDALLLLLLLPSSRRRVSRLALRRRRVLWWWWW
jgi:hypothetical protein